MAYIHATWTPLSFCKTTIVYGQYTWYCDIHCRSLEDQFQNVFQIRCHQNVFSIKICTSRATTTTIVSQTAWRHLYSFATAAVCVAQRHATNTCASTLKHLNTSLLWYMKYLKYHRTVVSCCRYQLW